MHFSYLFSFFSYKLVLCKPKPCFHVIICITSLDFESEKLRWFLERNLLVLRYKVDMKFGD